MTCWPRVIGNTIVDSDDKGISVGEDSEPFVFSNTIDGCDRGIEAKDRSAPIVLHTSITHCNRGIYAHIKNWRYGEAGWPKLVLSVVRDNKSDYVVQNGAKRTCEAR
jgi:parallel beta-helix repeat protein